ncbi:DUF4865 family protein [Kribbella deserti]|uniref:DUF4865 family protein n=1 Tax=Kribbella deserti TaxID=1926257 RepID=A0ABV6QJV3_9ACTN
MEAMQYEITLPADYDMDIIRRRVATNGHRMDDFDGLGVKAYLARDVAKGSVINQYAPFYLWADPAGMARFLWGGGGFAGICRDFGRPPVRRWAGVSCLAGPSRAEPVVAATRQLEQLPAEVDPDGLLELAEPGPGMHTTALAVDPATWQVVRFTLWTVEPLLDAGTRYDVLHVSAPGIERLSTG